MRSLIIVAFALVLTAIFSNSCSSGKKSTSELRGLMLLENTQLGRNRSHYSKHEIRKIDKARKKHHGYIRKR